MANIREIGKGIAHTCIFLGKAAHGTMVFLYYFCYYAFELLEKAVDFLKNVVNFVAFIFAKCGEAAEEKRKAKISLLNKGYAAHLKLRAGDPEGRKDLEELKIRRGERKVNSVMKRIQKWTYVKKGVTGGGSRSKTP